MHLDGRRPVMRKLRVIVVLGTLLALLYAGCSKRVDVRNGVLDRVVASTNPAAAFAVKNEDGKWWLISPEGRRFFSMGVCVVSRGSSKEDFDPENPRYAAWQHYESPRKWAEATTGRLRQWGFTTVGRWSD